MDYGLGELLEYCINNFDNYKKDCDNELLKEKYAKKLYRRILDCSESVRALSETEDKCLKRTAIPALFRIMIEAAIDLTNLCNHTGYEEVMEFYSKKEEIDFLEHNYENYENLLTDGNLWRDLVSVKKQEKIKRRYSLLEIKLKRSSYWKGVIWKKIRKNKYKLNSFVYLKMNLIRKYSKNKDRYSKYLAMYDICSAHSHNNISFLSGNGLKNISNYLETSSQFNQIMASILKNGLINFTQIIDCDLDKDELKELKKLNSEVAE